MSVGTAFNQAFDPDSNVCFRAWAMASAACFISGSDTWMLAVCSHLLLSFMSYTYKMDSAILIS